MRRCYGYCETLLNTPECEHPPCGTACDKPAVQTRCYRCGGRACSACSDVRRPKVGQRRIRMCRDCQESEGILEWAILDVA